VRPGGFIAEEPTTANPRLRSETGSSVAAELSLGAARTVDSQLTDIREAEMPPFVVFSVAPTLNTTNDGQLLGSFGVGRFCQRSRTKLERVGDGHAELRAALPTLRLQRLSDRVP
jgi:hypothetical protein